MKTYGRQLGLTLIELMIAMLVGLFLLAGIVMVFINSNRSNHMQENLARLQENGRFAIEFLTKDTRMVGYWDCMKPIAAPNNDDLKGTEGASGAPDSITIRGAFTRRNDDQCGRQTRHGGKSAQGMQHHGLARHRLVLLGAAGARA